MGLNSGGTQYRPGVSPAATPFVMTSPSKPPQAPFSNSNALPPPQPVFPANPSQILRLHLVYDPPVEGCELCPYVLLSNPNNNSTGSSGVPGTCSPMKSASSMTGIVAGENEPGVRYRWYRCLQRRACSNPMCPGITDGDGKPRYAKLQCAICAKIRSASQDTFFCSTDCFRATWKKHKLSHPATAPPNNQSDRNSARGKNATWFAKVSRPLEELADDEDALLRGIPGKTAAGMEEVDANVWLEVGKTRMYVPVKEDVGRILKFECAPVTKDGTVAGRTESIETSPVLAAPPIPADRRLLPLPSNMNKPLIGSLFKLLSYNILADIYAVQSVYSYCPSWALAWNFRKKNLLRELIHYRADILCLQEVQGDHYEEVFKPELSRQGYDGVYKQKTRASMGADGKMDGCAIFFKRDRFALREKHEIKYNDHARTLCHSYNLPQAALNRLMKDNIALVIVLEVLSDPSTMGPSSRARGRQDLLCVANTHIFWDPEYPDVKIWQVHTFCQELEKIVERGVDASGQRNMIPVIVGGDFNSLPESGVYELLSRGSLSPNHPDIDKDPFGVLGGSGPGRATLQHALVLRDSYAEASEELMDALPKYTNFTGHFVGDIDYVLYSPDRFRLRSMLQMVPEETLATHIALPSQQWSSDHVALMCEFELLPKSYSS